MLAQKLILSYSSRMTIQLIQVAASIVVARVAGPTVLGTVAFGLAFVSVFMFIADLGIGSAHVKLVSEGEDIGACISTYSILKCCTTAIFFAVVLGIFLIQKYVLNVAFESTAHEYVILIMLVTVTISQLLNIPVRTFAAKTEQAKQDIPDFVRTLLYQILRVVIVLLGWRAVALACGNLVSTILVIPLILYLFRGYPKGKFDRKLAYKYIRISLPIFIIGMSTNALGYLDKVMLQYFTNSEQVGFYTAGYRIGGFVLMIANSVGLLFFPTFSKAAAKGDFQYIKVTIERFERFSFLFIMPVVICLSLYSDVIIKVLLGQQYLPSVMVMAIVNLAMFLMVLNMPYGNVITGMGFFNLAAILNLTNLFLFIGMLFVFPNPKIGNLGATGAALAVLASNLFIGSLYRLFAKRKCVILDMTTSMRFMVFGVINICIFYLLYVHTSSVFGVGFKIGFVIIYFVVTYLVLLLLGWIKRDDLRNLKQVTKIKTVGTYIRDEIAGKVSYGEETKDN